MTRPRIGRLLAFLALFLPAAAAASPPPLAELIRKEAPKLYELAVKEGARIEPTSDGKSFYVAWFPPESEGQARPPVLVSLHGNKTNPFGEFRYWQPLLREKGYGFIGLQWQVQEGEKRRDYLPPEIHLALQDALLREGVRPGTALFQGYSRGSAVGYSVVNLDRFEGRGYFRAAFANSGGARPDFPQNLRIRERAKNGEKPFEGTRWIFFSAGKDRAADFTTPEAIRATSDWVRGLGGEVWLHLEDPEGGHDSFHRNPRYGRQVLERFALSLAEENHP